MQIKCIPTFLILVISLSILGGIALAQQDRYTLKVPDGLAFSEFRGYDTWQDVAPSATEDSIKTILANPTMMNAYKEGIPGNGKPFPEGSKIVKIEWVKKKNPVSQSPSFSVPLKPANGLAAPARRLCLISRMVIIP